MNHSLAREGLEFRLQEIVNSKAFQIVSLSAILLSSLVLGIETNETLVAQNRELFRLLDLCFVLFFVVELLCRFGASASQPKKFFSDGWNVFDAVVVSASLLPLNAHFIPILRLFRILRVLRLISHVGQLRLIVETMIRSLASLGYIAILLGLVFYVYAVAGVFVFGSYSPQYFGSFSTTMMTLFQTVTLEGWVDVMNTVRPHLPILAPIYFVSFIILGTMIVMNLFIGVIVNSLSEAQQQLASSSSHPDTKEIQRA